MLTIKESDAQCCGSEFSQERIPYVIGMASLPVMAMNLIFHFNVVVKCKNI